MLLNLCVLLIFYSSGMVLSAPDHSDDVYWRDYNGDVPNDALPGGLDRDRNPTYIGQVVAQGAIIPGQIFGGAQKIYYQGDYSAREATENIKILCTRKPENVEWVKTTGADIRYIALPRLIPGGYQYSGHMYIGRGIAGNVLSVGKVTIPTERSRQATFKASVDGDSYSPNEFEVLCHRMRNPDVADSSSKVSFGFALASLIVLVLLL
uniref:Uncharacterized protein n=1 Tax=Photinus pyralis TaxID=7054 RepID=A0A1Y1MM68_PHOPY